MKGRDVSFRMEKTECEERGEYRGWTGRWKREVRFCPPCLLSSLHSSVRDRQREIGETEAQRGREK